MTTLPASGYLSNAARTIADEKQAFEDVRDVIAEMIGSGGAAEQALTIAGGNITPAARANRIFNVDTEAAAASDDLDHILQTNVPDGGVVLLRSNNAGRTVVVRHAQAGAGQLLLADGANLSLVSTKMWLLLERRGTDWNEVLRSYGDQKAAYLTFLGAAALAGASFTGDVTIGSTDAGAGTGPSAILDRNSATPAANDLLGTLTFRGRSSTAVARDYARVDAQIIDATNASEDARGRLLAMTAGAEQSCAEWSADGFKMNAVTTTTAALAYSSDAGAGTGPIVELHRDSASPASSDACGQIQFTGEDSASTKTNIASVFVAWDDPTDGAGEAAHLSFQTRQANSHATRFNIGNGLYAQGVTGGDKGAGTGNFTAAYDDGTLLTCYVHQAWLEAGAAVDTLDLTKWDETVLDVIEPAATRKIMTGVIDPETDKEIVRFEQVPERIVEARVHEPARRFMAVAEQRLDTEQYVAFIREQRHLPSMPSPADWEASGKKMAIGDLLQRLWEEVEVLSVHAAKMHERIKELEAR